MIFLNKDAVLKYYVSNDNYMFNATKKKSLDKNLREFIKLYCEGQFISLFDAKNLKKSKNNEPIRNNTDIRIHDMKTIVEDHNNGEILDDKRAILFFESKTKRGENMKTLLYMVDPQVKFVNLDLKLHINNIDYKENTMKYKLELFFHYQENPRKRPQYLQIEDGKKSQNLLNYFKETNIFSGN